MNHYEWLAKYLESQGEPQWRSQEQADDEGKSPRFLLYAGRMMRAGALVCNFALFVIRY